MADMMERGISWLAGKLNAHASRQVVYRRGVARVTLNATLGRTQLTVDDGQGGVHTEYTDRDYLIAAADLILAGRATEPERDDMIEETVGTETLKYRVLPHGSEPPWRWSDPHRLIMRVHTKQVCS